MRHQSEQAIIVAIPDTLVIVNAGRIIEMYASNKTYSIPPIEYIALAYSRSKVYYRAYVCFRDSLRIG